MSEIGMHKRVVVMEMQVLMSPLVSSMSQQKKQ
jgi:hypothetical protein